jgi:tetratricopeptide (TPR) repeat protein
MSFLQDLGDRLPSGDRLYLMLAVVVIAAAVVVSIAFVGFFLVPELEARRENADQAAQVEQQILMTRQSEPDQTSEDIEAALATAEAEVDQAADVFFADAQAASLLDSLYEYADESDVEIVSLQNVPVAGEGETETVTQTQTAVFEANAFQLEALGTVADLLDFVSRIREAASPSFAIQNASVTTEDRGPTLTLDFTIYTSPFSVRTSLEPTVELTPSPTPANLAELEDALDTAKTRRDWERTINVLRQIGAIAPDYPKLEEETYRAYVEYGYQLLAEGRLDEAETQFNLALGIRPNGEEALTGLARISFTPTPTMTTVQRLEADLNVAWAEENWLQVIDILNEIQAIDPGYEGLTQKLYAAYVNRGYALMEQGKMVEARAAFSQALEINPEGGEAAEGLRRLAGDLTPESPTQPSPQPPQQDYVTYVVRPGDNLFRIALRYNTTVEAIMEANGLTTRTIHAGLQLRIPVQ